MQSKHILSTTVYDLHYYCVIYLLKIEVNSVYGMFTEVLYVLRTTAHSKCQRLRDIVWTLLSWSPFMICWFYVRDVGYNTLLLNAGF